MRQHGPNAFWAKKAKTLENTHIYSFFFVTLQADSANDRPNAQTKKKRKNIYNAF
jgi:hypothetical protein